MSWQAPAATGWAAWTTLGGGDHRRPGARRRQRRRPPRGLRPRHRRPASGTPPRRVGRPGSGAAGSRSATLDRRRSRGHAWSAGPAARLRARDRQRALAPLPGPAGRRLGSLALARRAVLRRPAGRHATGSACCYVVARAADGQFAQRSAQASAEPAGLQRLHLARARRAAGTAARADGVPDAAGAGPVTPAADRRALRTINVTLSFAHTSRAPAARASRACRSRASPRGATVTRDLRQGLLAQVATSSATPAGRSRSTRARRASAPAKVGHEDLRVEVDRAEHDRRGARRSTVRARRGARRSRPRCLRSRARRRDISLLSGSLVGAR